MKKPWHEYWTTIEARYRKRKWILRSQKYRFKQANRNAVLLLIGHGKRTSLETNLVSENELAIFSKGRQFRLSASKTAPFVGMQTKMTVKTPAWRSGTARSLEGWHSITYVEGPYQLRLDCTIRWCHALRVLGSRVFKDKTADWICWRSDSVNFFPSWFSLTYLIPKQSWRWHCFSFVNDIVMTVTLLAVLLNETFKGCYAALFISESTH